MPNTRMPIAGSERSAPPGRRVGAADPQENVEVSVYLKDKPAGTDRAACQEARTQRLRPVISQLGQ